MNARELLRCATLFLLPKGDKAPPPEGITGKGASMALTKAVRETLTKGDGNLAILLGQKRVETPEGWRGLMVIDEDNKPARTTPDGKFHAAQNGRQTIRQLSEKLGPLPQTLSSVTPGNGLHRVFWIPEELADVPAKVLARDVSLGKGVGVEVLTEGRYIVAPPSTLDPQIAAAKGYIAGAYSWVDPDAKIAELPRAWVEYLKDLRDRYVSSAPVTACDAVPIGNLDSDYARWRVESAVEYLKKAPLSIRGNGGRDTFFAVCVYLIRVLRLPIEVAADCVDKIYNPRLIEAGTTAWSLSSPGAHGMTILSRLRDAQNTSNVPPADVPDETTWSELPALWRSGNAPAPSAPAREELPVREKSVIFWDNWDQPLDPPKWLVEGLIPVGTVGGFVAHGSSLKTWTMLSLAAAIAKGVPWLGKYVTRKGRVLIVDYESGQYELQRRVQLLEGGKVIGLGSWSYPDKRIDDIELWKFLGTIPDVSMLYVDSLSEGTTPGVDENSRDAAYPLQLAARYTESTGASVGFVHHSKKDDGGDARKAVRGSTAIFAAMDWCYGFEPVEETSAFKRMRMSCIKPCMGAKPAPVSLELTDDGLQLFEGGKQLSSQTPDEELQARICLALQAGPIETKLLIAKKLGIRGSLVVPQVEALKVRREITKIDGIGYVLDSPGARVTRVMAVVNKEPCWKTDAQIAKLAHVTTSVVTELLRSGVLCRSAEGCVFVVDKNA